MNHNKILRALVVVGLVRMAIAAHGHKGGHGATGSEGPRGLRFGMGPTGGHGPRGGRFGMGSRGNEQWRTRVEEFHREMHRADDQQAAAPDTETVSA